MSIGRPFHDEKRSPRPRGGLRRKVTALICLSILVVSFIGAAIIYFWTASSISKTAKDNQMKIAEIVAASITDMIDEQIEQVRVFVTRPLIIKAIEECSLKYNQMSPVEMERYFASMDGDWISATGDSPLVKEYIDGKLSREHLIPVVKGNDELVEMFITDKFGGLVASSEKTSDFYQADERWWQVASEGSVFISDVELDKSSDVLGVTIAVPIIGSDGKVIGICKTIFDAQKLFTSLNRFKLGLTGHASLINDRGMIISQEGVKPLSIKMVRDDVLNRILDESGSFAIMDENIMDHAAIFTAFKRVDHPILLADKVSWFVAINQEVKEVFAPLYDLATAMLIFFGVAMLTIIPVGFIFGGSIVNSIKKIVEGTAEIGKGNLNYKIHIKTNDEMEDVAEALNMMTMNLQTKTTSIALLNQEINNRRKVEETLRFSAKFLQLLIDAIPIPVFYKNSNMVFVGCNSAFEKFMGLKREDIIGRPAYDIFPEGLVDINREQDNKFTSEGDSVTYEYRMEIFNGSYKNLIINRARYRDPVTGDVGTISAFFDITERSMAERAIAAAAKEWQKTFDSITDMVFIQDKDSTIIKANNAFVDAMKMKIEDVVGQKCYKVVHGGQAPWPNCPFEKTKGDNQAHAEEVNDPRIGIPLLVTTSPIFNKDGSLAGSVHITRDISDIKKAREELEKNNAELRKLDQLKSEFISMVSHELRTPLSIVKEGISLVLDNIPGKINEKQEHILTTAKDNIDRLARVIDSLLDISKIESGKVSINKAKFNIKELVLRTVNSFVLKARDKGLEVKAVVPDKDIYVYADADRITQVLVNLIDNAIKFTSQGKVDVSIEDKDTMIECSVTDTGVGISAEDLPRVFTRFQQFGRSAGPGEKGTGLGLAISKNIIELHKGWIRVESKIDDGSRFTFMLPKV